MCAKSRDFTGRPDTRGASGLDVFFFFVPKQFKQLKSYFEARRRRKSENERCPPPCGGLTSKGSAQLGLEQEKKKKGWGGG